MAMQVTWNRKPSSRASKALALTVASVLLSAGAISGQWLPPLGVVGLMVFLEILGRTQDAAAQERPAHAGAQRA